MKLHETFEKIPQSKLNIEEFNIGKNTHVIGDLQVVDFCEIPFVFGQLNEYIFETKVKGNFQRVMCNKKRAVETKEKETL